MFQPPTAGALSVGEVWERHHELDGQVIRVEGVVRKCSYYDCVLAESLEQEAKGLGIEASDTFDDEVRSYLGKKIVIEAKLDATCLHLYADAPSETAPICMDRASMLDSPKLRGLAPR